MVGLQFTQDDVADQINSYCIHTVHCIRHNFHMEDGNETMDRQMSCRRLLWLWATRAHTGLLSTRLHKM